MPKIRRTLLLKHVLQRPSDRYPELSGLDLGKLLHAALDNPVDSWETHFPEKARATKGKRCLYVRKAKSLRGGVLGHAFAYIAGHTPVQMNLNGGVANFYDTPIKDTAGNPVEIVTRFAFVCLQDALIVEAGRFPGENDILLRAIRQFITKNSGLRIPRLALQDVQTRNFRTMVNQGGGIKLVTATLESTFAPEPDTFGESMSKATDKFSNVRRVKTTIEADQNDSLDIAEMEDLFEESENGTGLSSIRVQLNNGTVISDLDSYREKQSIEIDEVGPGVPNLYQIESELESYVKQLLKPDPTGARIISTEGRILLKT